MNVIKRLVIGDFAAYRSRNWVIGKPKMERPKTKPCVMTVAPTTIRRMDLPRRNIELKARDPDPDGSLRAALALGATDEGWLHQTDTYFRVPNGRLKLREESPQAHLIAYNRVDQAAARESRYRIVPVSDPEELKQALTETLGVRVVVEKVRRLLLWHAARIHLDKVRDLGTFIEIEAVADPTSDLSIERRHASELEEALAIIPGRIVASSYSDELLCAGSSPGNGPLPRA